MQTIPRLALLLGCTLYVCAAGYGQRGIPSPRGGGPGGQTEASFNSVHFEEDTLDVGFQFFGQFDSVSAFADTLLRWFHQYDLNQIQGTSFFNLGFPGSPARPVLPQVADKAGFRLGLSQYDPYRISDQNFKFYRLRKAFTSARFTQGPTQEDGVFTLQFARDFKDNISLSLDYRRTNNQGFYTNQDIRNTQVGLGLRYVSPNRKWRTEGLYTTNRFRQSENGGITTDTLFNGDFSETRATIPVALSSGNTLDQSFAFHVRTEYALAKTDSSLSMTGVSLGHNFSWSKRDYLFSDPSTPNADYYGIFSVDSRGLRNAINHRQLKNDFFISLGKTVAYDKLILGMKNVSHSITQANSSQQFLNWIAHGDVEWNFGLVAIGAKAEIALGGGFESYTSEARLKLNLKSAGRLEGTLNLNSIVPTRIASTFAVSQETIWENGFKNTLENHLSATYHLPGDQLHISAGQLLITNGVYFDSEGQAGQETGTASLSYIRFYNRTQFGKFITENKIIFQFSGNDNLFRVPKWHIENTILFSDNIFKNVLNIETGFDLRFFDQTPGITYFPLLGQFILDDRFSIPRYPVLDFRLSFRVKYFRAFAEAENILQPFRNDVSLHYSRYPQQDLNIRIGIAWTFIN